VFNHPKHSYSLPLQKHAHEAKETHREVKVVISPSKQGHGLSFHVILSTSQIIVPNLSLILPNTIDCKKFGFAFYLLLGPARKK